MQAAKNTSSCFDWRWHSKPSKVRCCWMGKSWWFACGSKKNAVRLCEWVCPENSPCFLKKSFLTSSMMITLRKTAVRGTSIPLLSVRFRFILDWLLSKWKLLEAAFQCPFIVLPDLTVYFNSTVKQNLYITADVSANTCTNCIKIYDERTRE